MVKCFKFSSVINYTLSNRAPLIDRISNEGNDINLSNFNIFCDVI